MVTRSDIEVGLVRVWGAHRRLPAHAISPPRRRSGSILVAIAAASLLPVPGHAQAADGSEGVTVHRDLTYATARVGEQQQRLLLDLYLPGPAAPRPAPVVLFVHGGGWWQGSKSNCPGQQFASSGYAMACLDYRLASPAGCPSDLTFPAQVHDLKAAVRWLRLNAATYGLDSEHVGAMGDSSGGHLAALLGVSEGVSALSGTANPGASDAVQAVVDWYGPVDVRQPPPDPVFTDDPCTTSWEQLDQTYGGENTPFFYWTYAWGVFLGGSLTDPVIVAAAADATPLSYADASDPPFLIIHGTADGMVPIAQSRLLENALQAAGVSATFVAVEGGGHGFAGDGQQVANAFMTPTLAHFDRYLKSGGGTTSLSWVRTGGPPGGLGYDIRYSPDNLNTWYVTDAFAGVHMSTDNGLTWKPSNTGIPAETGPTADGRPVFSLTVDPHDPHVVWCGTDKTGHVYRSANGGETWEERDTGIVMEYDVLSFRGFTVDPRSSDTVYAMAETQRFVAETEEVGGVVYRTDDAGMTWAKIWDGGMPSSLARYLWIDPRDPNVLFVSTGIFDRAAVDEGGSPNPFGGVGVLKSTDGGQSWTILDEDNGLDMLYIGSLFMHPDNPDVLLAAAGHLVQKTEMAEYLDGLEVPINGVYRTDNGGSTWTQTLVPPQGQIGESFSSVEICTSNPSIAYAGSEMAVYRSQDAGQTWQMVTAGSSWGPPGVAAGWPIDLQCDPRDPDRIFANNYMGGNFLSEDGGATWRNASQGYTGAQVLAVRVDPRSPATVFAAGRNGIWRCDAGGSAWYGLRNLASDYPLPGMEFGTVAIDPSQPDHVLSGEASVIESFDGGLSWSYRWGLWDGGVDLVPGGIREPTVARIEFAPSLPSTVYAAVAERECMLGHEPCVAGIGVIVSSDGGASWRQTSTAGIGHVGVLDLAVDPSNPQWVFAATENGLFRTADGGNTWTPVSGGLPVRTRVRTVAIDPEHSAHMLAGADGLGVYSSHDGGTTWEPSSTGLEANGSLHDILFDPAGSAVVWVSDVLSGVYRSTDGGLTWTPISPGLSTRATTGLAISADGRHLYAATNGGGVFRLDLDGRPPVPPATVSPPPRRPSRRLGR